MDLSKIKEAVAKPLFDRPPWQRRIGMVWLVLRHSIPRALSRRSQQMAASLTYHTMFSLLPTVVLVLVTLQAFVSDEDREQLKSSVVSMLLEPLGHEEQPIDDTAWAPLEDGLAGPPDPVGLTDDALERRQEFDDVRGVLEQEATAVLNKLETVNFGSIGVFGFLVFIFATTGLLTTIQNTFDSIFGAEGNRPLHRRLPLYYSVLTLGPVVVLSGQWLQATILDFIAAGGHWTAWIAGPLVVLSPLLTTWMLLYAMFLTLPTVPVRPGAAAVGSLISAICWAVAMELFGYYVSNAAATSLYGALALLPLFMLWIFVIWTLLLLGMQFTVSIQTLRETGRLPTAHGDYPDVSQLSPGWTLEVAARLAAAFDKGKTLSTSRLQRTTGLPARTVQVIIEALCEGGYVQAAREEGTYGMARPSNDIRVRDLVKLHRIGVQRRALVETEELELKTRFHNGGAACFDDETLEGIAKNISQIRAEHDTPPAGEGDGEGDPPIVLPRSAI